MRYHPGLTLTGAAAATLLLAARGGSSSSGTAGGTGGNSGGTITIGVIGPMTGPAAEIGNLMSGACYAAVLDVNKAGGVLGRKLSCDQVDDTGDPAGCAGEQRRRHVGCPAVRPRRARHVRLGPRVRGQRARDVPGDQGVRAAVARHRTRRS